MCATQSRDAWAPHTQTQRHGVEQWLIKWKGYGEDRNTWEPWDNLLTKEVQQEANRTKDVALPSMAHKLTVPMLRETLQAKGLESVGLKDALGL